MFEGDHPNEILLSNLLSSNMLLREYVWEKTDFELQSALLYKQLLWSIKMEQSFIHNL